MPSDDVDQDMAEDAMPPADGMDVEETPQSVSKVKEEIVLCVQAGMLRQDQIDRQLRDKNYTSKYKEFREKNKDLFALHKLKMLLQIQIRRLHSQLALYREQLRRANASAGNPSCLGGRQPVAVPAPQHAEATLRATPSTPLAVAPPATATAQHAHCQLPGTLPPPPPPPNVVCRPGSSRGAALLFASGQMPEALWHVDRPARHASVPSGWPPAPPAAQRGACAVCAFHRQVGSQRHHHHQLPMQRGSQHQHEQQLPQRQQQQPLQHGSQYHHQLPRHQPPHHQQPPPLQLGSGNVGERQPAYCPPTPSHVQRLLPAGAQQQLPLQQGYQAEQRCHAGANSCFGTPRVGAPRQNLFHLPPQQPRQQQGGGNVDERQGQPSPPAPPPNLSQELLVMQARERSNKPTAAAAVASRRELMTFDK